MINRIKQLLLDLGGSELQGGARPDVDQLQVAAAALMVEAARMDDHFDSSEREKITALVRARFGLNDDEADTLVRTAADQVAESEQLFSFTRVIKDRFSIEQRIELIETLWEIVYADEELHHYESNLMRRIAGLLYVSDRDSGAARKRALARLDRGRSSAG